MSPRCSRHCPHWNDWFPVPGVCRSVRIVVEMVKEVVFYLFVPRQTVIVETNGYYICYALALTVVVSKAVCQMRLPRSEKDMLSPTLKLTINYSY